MKFNAIIDQKSRCGWIYVNREPKDPAKFYSESLLLHHVKLQLSKWMKKDFIKKLMWKDGHLVADTCHYIRERKGTPKWLMAIWDDQYAIRSLCDEWNKNGQIKLRVENLNADHEAHNQ